MGRSDHLLVRNISSFYSWCLNVKNTMFTSYVISVKYSTVFVSTFLSIFYLFQIWTAMRKEGPMMVPWRRKAGLGMLLTHARSHRHMATPRMSSSCPGAPLLKNGLESVLALQTQIPVAGRAPWVAPHPSIVPLWNFLDLMEARLRPRTRFLL